MGRPPMITLEAHFVERYIPVMFLLFSILIDIEIFLEDACTRHVFLYIITAVRLNLGIPSLHFTYINSPSKPSKAFIEYTFSVYGNIDIDIVLGFLLTKDP